MKFFSTRGAGPVSIDVALVRGLAEDGGLFMPEQLPAFSMDAFCDASSLQDVAVRLYAPFIAESALRDELPAIAERTFSFPIPLTDLDGTTCRLLELYHGPTAAFKDVGARFLSACLTRLEGDVERPVTILVATSGDTGGAVAAAFDQQAGMQVVVLFPAGRVSARQAHQLSCWSDNVLTLEVEGSFDDCQAMVKAALSDSALREQYRFSSANSINIGRLLPQSTYYAHSSLMHRRETGREPSFVIPTGNLGNALACVMAREMGFPIGEIVLATNANRTIADFFETLQWVPRASLQTLATAMDVGNPSNMERLRGLLGDAAELKQRLGVVSVSDAAIESEIKTFFAEQGFAICPHTATATSTWRALRAHSDSDWILAATAHPAKFETVVEPLIGQEVPIPEELAALLARPSRAVRVPAEQAMMVAAMQERFSGLPND